MSDLADFTSLVLNGKKTLVTKTHSSSTNANVTGNVGLELSSLEHTITDNVQSVVMVVSFSGSLQGSYSYHDLKCWKGQVIPTYDAESFDHTNLIGGATLWTTISGRETKSCNFVLVDNNVSDSTAMTYKWTLLTQTGNTQNRSITVKYYTNPHWDLRDL